MRKEGAQLRRIEGPTERAAAPAELEAPSSDRASGGKEPVEEGQWPVCGRRPGARREACVVRVGLVRLFLIS